MRLLFSFIFIIFVLFSCALPVRMPDGAETPEVKKNQEAVKPQDFAEVQKEIILVFDFKPSGVTQDEALAVTDLFRAEMIASGKYVVTGKIEQDAYLKEHVIAEKKVFDEQEAIAAGKALSSKRIIMGVLEKSSSSYSIKITVIDVDTGNVAASLSHSFTSEKNIPDAVKFLNVSLKEALSSPAQTKQSPDYTKMVLPAVKKFNYGDFRNADLTGKDYSGSEFKYANFLSARLSNSKFTGADFRYANFINSNMSNSDFSGASFDYCNFSGANLSDSNFKGASFARAKINAKWKKYLEAQTIKGGNAIVWMN